MKHIAIPIAGLLLIAAAGFHNRQRSQAAAQNGAIVKEAAENLKQQVPRKIGDWTGEDVPVEDRALRVGEIAGCVSRKYTHLLTGEIAQMVLTCGAPGPISVHTPDVCFEGHGFEMITPPKRITLKISEGREAKFWWADFQKGSVEQRMIQRTFWSWNGQAGWQISERPRIEFADLPVLYKLYVALPINPSDVGSMEEPKTGFLLTLLRELETDLPDTKAERLEP